MHKLFLNYVNKNKHTQILAMLNTNIHTHRHTSDIKIVA